MTTEAIALPGRSRWIQGKRLASNLRGMSIVIWSVVTLFVISQVVSPDPTASLVPSQANESTRLQVRQNLGIDSPILEQYLRLLKSLLRGDLRTSFTTGLPVSDGLLRRVSATFELGLVALIFGVQSADRLSGYWQAVSLGGRSGSRSSVAVDISDGRRSACHITSWGSGTG
jgi:ABC-type dipeptide/oligopeptide/nickel transport system permease component